jgi:hypothetical protein
MTADAALSGVDATASHHPHAIAISHDGGSAVLSDHPHMGASSAPAAPEMLTAALPPRVGTALAAVGMITAFVAAAALFTHAVPPAMRGPPRALAALPTGQDVVTRFCIARR